jgi:hypothetical protein
VTINSCKKGKVYERELAADLRAAGFADAHRGQQHKGGEDSPDVVGLPGFHIEAKRVEALNLYEAMAQAERDAGIDDVPIVVHRRNGKRSVAIIDWQAFLLLVKQAKAGDPAGEAPRPSTAPHHQTNPLIPLLKGHQI